MFLRREFRLGMGDGIFLFICIFDNLFFGSDSFFKKEININDNLINNSF